MNITSTPKTRRMTTSITLASIHLLRLQMRFATFLTLQQILSAVFFSQQNNKFHMLLIFDTSPQSSQ